MDFTVAQKGNTRFMYVLPYAKNEALFEYTLFSKELLPYDHYKSEIEKYLKDKNITDYEIIEKEQGSIPMTSYKFWKNNSKNKYCKKFYKHRMKCISTSMDCLKINGDNPK